MFCPKQWQRVTCKFDSKADEGSFVGYVTNSHAYRVYNKRLMIVEESVHVVFDETHPMLQDQRHNKNTDDEDVLLGKQFGARNKLVEKEIQSAKKVADNNLPKEWIKPKGLSKDNIIGDISQGVSTRCKLVFFEHVAFVSQIEPKNVNDAWVIVIGLLLCKMSLINSQEIMCGLKFLELMK